MEVIVVAVIVSIVAPTILAHQVNRARRADKAQDWERQDKVAAEVQEAARLLVESNAITATATAEVNEKLAVIHTLVNSNMTAAMQAERDATVRELAMMLEVVDLKRAAGHDPTPGVGAAIDATTRRVEELDAALADRFEQATLAATMDSGT